MAQGPAGNIASNGVQMIQIWLGGNLEFTREIMRRQREQTMFDKSKSIITQVVGNKGTYCYLSRGGKWLLARLTKASPFYTAW